MFHLQDFVTRVTQNERLFIEFVVGFYLDADAYERQRIEQLILNLEVNLGNDSRQEMVLALQELAAARGL